MGHITEITTVQKPVPECPCRRIDKDHYYDTRTGEIFDYAHIENRAGSAASVRRTLSKIRALINTNCTEPENIRWVTLTYAENMTDTRQLYSDYEKFWKRFLYWCKKQGYEKPEYISVQEPQGRGAWHIHAFFIWPSKAPFIPNNDVLEVLWRHGWTKCKAVDDCDNIGAYFSAYLADMPLDEFLERSELDESVFPGPVTEKAFVNDEGLQKDKRFVKGGRLHLYPPGMNILRYSKGIKKPIVEKMFLFEARKKVSAATETFSRAYAIKDDCNDTIQVVSKAYYNSKR